MSSWAAWLGAAASVALLHTVSGPDHYLPFIAMARAGRWSRRKTLLVTAICGAGHLVGSVLLAWIGVQALVGVDRLLALETLRGEIAAWGMIVFGLVYLAWGIRCAARGRSHAHWHTHADGTVHRHHHSHHGDHLHAHATGRGELRAWALFLVFLLGPCEPLIPLLVYVGATHGIAAGAGVTVVFALVTLACMVALVLGGLAGLDRIRGAAFERYAHAVAGAVVLGCGVGVMWLGL